MCKLLSLTFITFKKIVFTQNFYSKLLQSLVLIINYIIIKSIILYFNINILKLI